MIFDQMKRAISHLLPAIYSHPFNQELIQGNLPRSVFDFYVRQDALYIRDFSKALSLVSDRFSLPHHTKTFMNFQEQIIRFESKLQNKYLIGSVSPRFYRYPLHRLEKIPEIVAYTGHLLEAAQKSPVEVAVASLVPCFWVYNDLGRMMQSLPGNKICNPYYSWINSYSGRSFTAATQAIIQITNELGEGRPDPIQKQMIGAFVTSTEYELSFWNGVYKKPGQNHEANPGTKFKFG